jgi:hypothetical protein
MGARTRAELNSNGLPTEAYWRGRATRSRLCAAATSKDEVREALLNIAIMYDAMADRAARREARAQRRNSVRKWRSPSIEPSAKS